MHLTIGSLDIGRAPISVDVSGPIPALRRLQVGFPLLIHVMYAPSKLIEESQR